MQRILTLVAAVLLGFSGEAVAQATDSEYPEYEAAQSEWVKFYNAGQHDEAIAAAQKYALLAQKHYGAQSQKAGWALNSLAMTYHQKQDWANAESSYRRALAIFDQTYGPNKICNTLSAIGYVSYRRHEMGAAVGFYEAAVTCFFEEKGLDNSSTLDTLVNLSKIYISGTVADEFVAERNKFFEKWIPLVDSVSESNKIYLAKLLNAQAKHYFLKDNGKARNAALRALPIAARQPNPVQPDQERLKLEADLLSTLQITYPENQVDATYMGYLARRAAILEKIHGPSNSETVRVREHLAMLQEAHPEIALATTASSGLPVARPANSSTPAPAVAPSSSGLIKAGGLRLTPQGATLKAPKGYEHIKPAQLYTINIDALNDPRWIVARSKAEAVQIGQKPMYGFYSVFNSCMAGLYDRCRETIELDFGWMAFVTATGFTETRGRKEQKIAAYVAYGAPSRQIAIDGALAEYRRNRGSDGVIAQQLTVGLVSELDWQAIEERNNRTGNNRMGELNYKTICDWAPRVGFNQNPEPTTGKIDGDPACKNNEDPPGQKLPLPPPVLVTTRPAR